MRLRRISISLLTFFGDSANYGTKSNGAVACDLVKDRIRDAQTCERVLELLGDSECHFESRPLWGVSIASTLPARPESDKVFRSRREFEQTPMRFYNSTTSRSPVLLIIAAVLLFCLGPQMGSLDTDGDGYPETTLEISTPVPVAQSSSLVSNQPSRIRTASVLADVVIRSYNGERDGSGSPAGRAALKSLCMLRC